MADATSGTRLVSEDGRYAVVQVQFDDNAQSVPVTDRALIPERGEPPSPTPGSPRTTASRSPRTPR